MQKDDDWHARIIPRTYPMRDPLMEEILPNFDGNGGISGRDILLRRLIARAMKGSMTALAEVLRRAAKHQIDRIDAQELAYDRIDELFNLDYKWVGDVAELLGIATRYEPPDGKARDKREQHQRFRLADWVLECAQERGTCSDDDLKSVQDWVAKGCEQWRRDRSDGWNKDESEEYVPRSERRRRVSGGDE